MGDTSKVEGVFVLSPTVIVLASRIGAGKSTVAHALHRLTGFPVVSFGQYVKNIASNERIGSSRENLQDLGERLVSLNPVSFTEGALSNIDLRGGAIIDGLRHSAVFDALGSIASGIRIVLIFLQTSDDLRFERLLARGMSSEEIRKADGHVMEQSVEVTLFPAADLVIDGSSSSDENAERIIHWITGSKSDGT